MISQSATDQKAIELIYVTIHSLLYLTPNISGKISSCPYRIMATTGPEISTVSPWLLYSVTNRKRNIFPSMTRRIFAWEDSEDPCLRVTKPISKPGGNLKAANMLVSNVCQGIRCCCCRNLFWNSTFLGLAISIQKDHVVQWAHSCHSRWMSPACYVFYHC